MAADIAFRREAGGGFAELGAADSDSGTRLDRFLARGLPSQSRTQLKRLVMAGHVTLAGDAMRDPALKVRAGQIFVVFLPDAVDPAPRAEAIPLDIRFEDAYLIVIDKPAGMVVHPAPGNPDGTLVNALLAHCGTTLSGIGGVRRPGIVHRLDKDTSGLLVVAKTEAAHRALSRDFAAHRIDRAYSAFVWGVPVPAAGALVGNIGRSPVNRKKMAVVEDGRGKPAATHYRVERRFKQAAALLDCRLATGRTHQIRVHLADRGHALIGDPLYGSRTRRAGHRAGPAEAAVAAFPRQALHARRLGFRHPESGEALAFDSPLPADLGRLQASLELL